MKTIFILILFLLVAIMPLTAALGQEPLLKISFESSDVASVYSLTPFESDWQLKAASASAIQNEDDQLFYSYWTASSFSHYKSLFRPNEAPAISEQEFTMWSTANSGAEILVRGKVYLEVSGYKLSIIQFGMGSGNALRDNAFLIKKEGESWYPVTSAENKKFHELITFFSVVKPEALATIFDLEGFDIVPLLEPEEVNKFKATLISAGVLDGSLLLSKLQEAFYFSSETSDRSYLKLTYLYKPEAARALSPQDIQMQTYLDSLGLSAAQKSRVLKLIRNNLYVEAASAIKEAKGDPSSHSYVLRIREIYGEDKIKIYDSRDNQWH